MTTNQNLNIIIILISYGFSLPVKLHSWSLSILSCWHV